MNNFPNYNKVRDFTHTLYFLATTTECTDTAYILIIILNAFFQVTSCKKKKKDIIFEI